MMILRILCFSSLFLSVYSEEISLNERAYYRDGMIIYENEEEEQLQETALPSESVAPAPVAKAPPKPEAPAPVRKVALKPRTPSPLLQVASKPEEPEPVAESKPEPAAPAPVAKVVPAPIAPVPVIAESKPEPAPAPVAVAKPEPQEPVAAVNPSSPETAPEPEREVAIATPKPRKVLLGIALSYAKPEKKRGFSGTQLNLSPKQSKKLRERLNRFIGSPLSMEKIREIKNEITLFYKQIGRGYVEVQIPAQEMEDSILKIKVVKSSPENSIDDDFEE